MLLFHDQNYGIHYEYTVPVTHTAENQSEPAKAQDSLFIWTHSGWEGCSVQCGGGEWWRCTSRRLGQRRQAASGALGCLYSCMSVGTALGVSLLDNQADSFPVPYRGDEPTLPLSTAGGAHEGWFFMGTELGQKLPGSEG